MVQHGSTLTSETRMSTIPVYNSEGKEIEVVVFAHNAPRGKKPLKPLMFIHGWGLSPKSYHRPLSALAGEHAVYAPTLPGFGKSSKLRKNFTLDDFAQVVHEAWEGCDLPGKKVPIVAHSMGSGVAVKLSLRAAPLVKSLTLVCPIGGGGNFVSWPHLIESFRNDATYDMFTHAIDSLPSLLRNPRGAARSAWLAKTAHLEKDIRICVASGIDVRIVFATKDSITPPGAIRKIEGVKYLSVPGTHGWLLKEPELFRDIVYRGSFAEV